MLPRNSKSSSSCRFSKTSAFDVCVQIDAAGHSLICKYMNTCTNDVWMDANHEIYWTSRARATDIEGDDDAGGVVGGELDGRAEQAVLIHGRRDETRT
jgi:hypothetical protein